MRAPTTSRILTCALVAAALLMTAWPAEAQFGMGSRRGSRPEPGLPRQSGAPAVPAADALYEARIRLAITPEQAGPWDAFYRSYLVWTGVAASGRLPASAGNAVQMADQLAAQAQARFAAAQELAQAVKGLVAVLTESQKPAADSLLPHLLALETAMGVRITAR